jgi:hypothetical protein
MKRQLKKLELNRETLRTLEATELSEANGGVTARYCYTDTCTCETWCYHCLPQPVPY